MLSPSLLNLSIDHPRHRCRNYLLTASVRLSVLTVSISSASLITSALGMNLSSGLDGSSPVIFWAAVGASIGAAAACYRAFDRMMTRSNPATAHAKRLNAFQDLLYKLDTKMDAAQTTFSRVAGGMPVGASPHLRQDDGDATSFLSLRQGAGPSPASGVRLSKEEFRSLHERTTGRPVSDEEAEMLFELLDSDSDGQLRLEEALTTLQGQGAATGSPPGPGGPGSSGALSPNGGSSGVGGGSPLMGGPNGNGAGDGTGSKAAR